MRCAAVGPVSDEPSVGHRLVAYGSLRPGEQHADVLAGLRGEWEPVTLRGDLVWVDGYPVLTPRADGPLVAAELLTSPDLPAAWSMLDEFEGSGYRREIIAFERPDGTVGVGACYVAA